MDLAPAGYGAAFADVYDDWYGPDRTTPAAVDMLAALAEGDRVLDVGAGTGRLALPLAARGLEVVAVDASPDMLCRLRAKAGDTPVDVVVGDAVDLRAVDHTALRRPFGLTVVARNTVFNLLASGPAPACFTGLAAVLRPGGALVIEADVLDPGAAERGASVHRRGGREVVLRWRHDPAAKRLWGSFVDGRGRSRPWAIRYAAPGELDAWADAAGLALERRQAGWDDGGPGRERHVSIYRRRAND